MLEIEKSLDDKDYAKTAELISNDQSLSRQEQDSLLARIRQINYEGFFKHQLVVRIRGSFGYESISEDAADARACYLALIDNGIDSSNLSREIQAELLELAMIDGDLNRLKNITQAIGEDWVKFQIGGATLYQYAAMNSPTNILEYIFESDPTQLEVILDISGKKDENHITQLNGYTPLLLSAVSGKWDNVEWLIKHGANSTVKGHVFDFASACVSNSPETINLLHAETPDVFNGILGYYLLDAAVSRNNNALINQLIEFGAAYVDPSRPTYSSIIETAIRKNNKTLIIDILDKNPELLNYQDDGTDVIAVAARSRHLDLVKLFIERGAQIGRKSFSSIRDEACKKEILLAGINQHYFSTNLNDHRESLGEILDQNQDEELIAELFEHHPEKMCPFLNDIGVLNVLKNNFIVDKMQPPLAIEVLANVPDDALEDELYASDIKEMIIEDDTVSFFTSCFEQIKSGHSEPNKIMSALSKATRFSLSHDEINRMSVVIQQAQAELADIVDFSSLTADLLKAKLKVELEAIAHDPHRIDEIIQQANREEITREDAIQALSTVNTYNYEWRNEKLSTLLLYLRAQKDLGLLRLLESNAQTLPTEHWQNILNEIERYEREETNLPEDLIKRREEAEEYIAEAELLNSPRENLEYPDALTAQLANKLQAGGFRFQYDKNEQVFELAEIHKRAIDPTIRIKPLKQTSNQLIITVFGAYNKEKFKSFDEFSAEVDEPFNVLKADLNSLENDVQFSDDGHTLTIIYGDDQRLEFEISFFKEGYLLKQIEFNEDHHRPMFTDATELKLYLQDINNFIDNPKSLDTIPSNEFESEYFRREQEEYMAKSGKNLG